MRIFQFALVECCILLPATLAAVKSPEQASCKQQANAAGLKTTNSSKSLIDCKGQSITKVFAQGHTAKGKSIEALRKHSVPSQLFEAIKNDDRETLQKLIDSKMDLNAADDDDRSPLTLSKDLNLLEFASMLRRSGAFDTRSTKELIWHASQGAVEGMKQALESDADPNGKTSDGKSPLYNSIQRQCGACALILLKAGARPNAVQSSETAPLTLAAAQGNEEIAIMLLDFGAEVNFVNLPRGTAAYWAAVNDHHHLVSELIKRGAVSPYSGDELVQALIKKDENRIEIALHTMLDLNTPDANGDRPLLAAVVHEDIGSAKTMIHFGANINAMSKGGYTPIMAAAYHNSLLMTEFCLTHGAIVNTRHANGRTPLMIAAWKARSEIIAHLISAGANINSQDNEGWTSLMFAIESENPKSINLLLSNGAETHLQTSSGLNATDLAERKGLNGLVNNRVWQ